MKLSDYLSSLIGKTITAENVTAISAEVDNIKNRAVEKETSKLTSLQKKFQDAEKQLEQFQSKETDAKLKEAFVTAGGNPEKFESFKKVTGQVEKLEDIKFEETFKEFPGLQGTQEPEEDPFVGSSNLANIQKPDNEKVETPNSSSMGMDTGTIA